MGWETRKRGGLYYYRKERVGGKVKSVYVGGFDEYTILSEQFDDMIRQKKASIRGAEQEEEKRLNALSVEAAEDYAAVEMQLRAALTAAGYHRHHQGEWRKRRDDGEQREHAKG